MFQAGDNRGFETGRNQYDEILGESRIVGLVIGEV